ncbi:LacI family DNA-binding transcriptional regulator [Bifidobacterium callimiconis]|uniref:LacI family DNA-binding transcriptional regulator n=1 Tax=Bifidobacterium callimiconis TaxID=2306973 RepID=UPI001BDDC635|nr:LacI family DNA-binding transcriptional regulator [Bifidobacterium callimiconis]MBT1175979.1 LacI family DNA-binding transcriptional regulator [Bifidobacterium callimiconis]
MAETERRILVSDIARMCGVSTTTVSKVINGREDVSDKTRRKVERILEQVGFSKPLASTKITNTIEIVMPHMANNGTIGITRACAMQVKDKAIGITITETGDDEGTDDALLGLLDRNPLGAVVMMSAVSDQTKSLLASRGIPFVILDPIEEVGEQYCSVSIDNWTAGFNATNHLIRLGHRRIATITGPRTAQSSMARFAGYSAAMGNAGLDWRTMPTASGDYLAEPAYRAACQLLDLPAEKRPTAIFAFNDLSAVCTYKAAYERNIRIPDDLSVVGFDNVYPAKYMAPALTTIDQPFDLMAKKAIAMILEARENNGAVEEPHVILPTRLIVRDSTTAPSDMANTTNTADANTTDTTDSDTPHTAITESQTIENSTPIA